MSPEATDELMQTINSFVARANDGDVQAASVD